MTHKVVHCALHHRFKRFVSAEPEIEIYDLSGHEDFLVLACDGLWDVMNPQSMVQFAGTYRAENGTNKGCAKGLVKEYGILF